MWNSTSEIVNLIYVVTFPPWISDGKILAKSVQNRYRRRLLNDCDHRQLVKIVRANRQLALAQIKSTRTESSNSRISTKPILCPLNSIGQGTRKPRRLHLLAARYRMRHSTSHLHCLDLGGLATCFGIKWIKFPVDWQHVSELNEWSFQGKGNRFRNRMNQVSSGVQLRPVYDYHEAVDHNFQQDCIRVDCCSIPVRPAFVWISWISWPD